MTELLKVEGLTTRFNTEGGIVNAVQDVSFTITRGETFALVGESGCGKSVTALSIMRLIPDPPGRIVNGRILYNGQNLLDLKEKEMRSIRGNKIAMIFQEPMTSLNPVYTIGDQIAEAIQLHQKKDMEGAWQEAVEALRKVGIADPGQRVHEYPYQMSGGMRQRVMIAMGISSRPELLIADEPTTALDVTIQAQILDLMDSIKEQYGMSVLIITHNLGIVAERADRVAVMYAARIVETGGAEGLFKNPLHPYTRGLLDSLPKLGEKRERLLTIPGNVPNPLRFPSGCRFHPRCPIYNGDSRCQEQEPMLEEKEPGHKAACWKV
ncbi:MAG: ABC transporter ATP-binding protein [Desulfatiglans sp.]|jgi:oligopeptide/dipeptide ABC transporter ATP-binding protein|nr:ABC transporter ATP-binding protein [Desulfatiglans sp.]